MGCDLERHPRPECKDCKEGERNVGKAATPDPRGNETIQRKKEEVGKVGDMKVANERVLSRILREKACGRTRLMTHCGVSSAELNTVARELEKEGKIKSWPNGRSCFYTPPGAPDPWGAKKKAAPIKSDGDPRPAAPRKPRAKPLSATGKDVVDDKLPADGAHAEVIKNLEAKRQNIDNAIAALKALG